MTQALKNHLNRLPRAGPLSMNQLWSHPLPVERAVALPAEDEVALRGRACRRTASESRRCDVDAPSPFSRVFFSNSPRTSRKLRLSDQALEISCGFGVIHLRHQHIKGRTRTATEQELEGGQSGRQGWVWPYAFSPTCSSYMLVPWHRFRLGLVSRLAVRRAYST